MTERILGIDEAIDLAEIISMAQSNAKVARVLEDGNLFYGTARSIGTDTGGFIRRDDDVRDAYLRITSRSGWEHFIPIVELLPQVRSHEFVKYDW